MSCGTVSDMRSSEDMEYIEKKRTKSKNILNLRI